MLRFVPPSTGELTIGDLRIALLNYLASRQRGEGFLLRIDDTDPDPTNTVDGETIKQILEKFALPPDQVTYRSSQLGRYQQLAVRLVEEGRAFLCTCGETESPDPERRHSGSGSSFPECDGHCLSMGGEEIRRIREEKIPYLIRIRKPDEPVIFRDRIRGEIRSDPDALDHFVILRADGTPTRRFACACDDMMDAVTLVIREERYLDETPREIHIRQSLGYTTETEYLHLPPPEGKTPSIRELLEEGFLPDAILNSLLLADNETATEIFTLPEAVDRFDPEQLSSPARFDRERLRRLNREHLRRMDDLTLSRIFRFADADVGRLAKLYLEEAATVNELERAIRALFSPKRCKGEGAETMRRLSRLVIDAPYFTAYSAFEEYLATHSGLTEEALRTALGLLMRGSVEGPAPEKLYPLIKSYITEIARCQH
jgi:glutamyl-tRNA synthetase